MHKIKIITQGKVKKPWLKEAIQEYENRMQKEVAFTWVSVKKWDKSSLEEPYVALAIEGKPQTSPSFAKMLEKILIKQHCRLTILIGGPDGLPEEIKKKSSFLWSLSLMTFTQEMTHLLLIEQIYRAFQINKKSPYHK